MKKICAILLICLVSTYYSMVYSQDLSTGFFSGINISDIHRNDIAGKWKFKPGPVQGAFLNYNLTPVLGIGTGLNFSTVYYEQVSYRTIDPMIYSYSSTFSDMYIPYNPSSDFTYLTVPVQLRLTIPSRPDLNLAAGAFYSFVMDKNSDKGSTYKYDAGYIYSAGIEYPFSENFSGLFNIRYLTGTKKMWSSYRSGSMDFSIGVAFNGFMKKDNHNTAVRSDSSFKGSVTYFGGMNVSWNSEAHSNTGYSQGISAGFRIDFPLSGMVSFRTGLSFDQKGYSFRDSTDAFFTPVIDGYARYLADTRTTVDYIEIPAYLKFSIGKSKRIFFSTGPWLAVKLNARCTGDATSVSIYSSSYRLQKTTVYDDIGQLIRGNDFGWSFGTGVSVPFFGKTEVEIGAEYKPGFRNVFERSNYTPADPYHKIADIKNSSFSVHLGLIIPGIR